MRNPERNGQKTLEPKWMAVNLGGLLVGDTLRLSNFLGRVRKFLKPSQCLTALCDDWNEEAVELFEMAPEIPISERIVVPFSEILDRAGREERNRAWDPDVSLFRADPVVEEIELAYDRIFYPSLPDLHDVLTAFEVVFKDTPEIDLPERFIAVHPSSVSKWKEIPALFAAEFSLPVVNVGGLNERSVRDAQIENGRPLWETAWILKQAAMVVGICSSITQLAVQIGCRVVMCHFDEWCFKFLGVRDLGGRDLLNPGRIQIEKTVEAMIRSLECNQPFSM